jgi:hypothetical protein
LFDKLAMHKPGKPKIRRLAEARLADKNLHIVPESIGTDNYVAYILKNKINHIITFNEFGRDIEKRLIDKKVLNSNYPLVVGHTIVEAQL